jgi:hypothetical protein
LVGLALMELKNVNKTIDDSPKMLNEILSGT